MLTPFITNDQFLRRYDYRWVAQDLLDDGTIPTYADLTNTSTTAGSRLQDFAFEASEIVLSAAAVAARYSEDDLRDYGGYLLLRICADLMVGLILKRRNRAVADEKEVTGPYAEALGYLELLRRGERIFSEVPDVSKAGLPETASMNPILGINPSLITQRAYRYFGPIVGDNF
jgi:hypothetical protein